ncbi:MAG: NAD(P)(+) transhydrogenase (Re/Si-specific) subunit beta, partial [Pyrinomonadaceae bacterium]|nr:NAD(P)(+) transhydrogenase (Re/Si-specific) subunit beta [Pyrinomonadaceae bacterium]
MNQSLITVAYIAASALFILSLGGLSQQSTARRGNLYGILGMLIALIATVFAMKDGNYAVLAAALIPGLVIGAILAARVQMTSMPELVAMLHSFVGLAAVLVGFATYLGPHKAMSSGEHTLHLVEIFLGVIIGSVTFTGSVIAFLKLRGTIGGKPFMLPGRHVINLIMLIATIGLGAAFLMSPDTASGQWPLLIGTVVAGILGVHFIMAIGGADMPVVVSMLNSYSGWAAAAAGFMLGNDLLIITGALVGASGAILSYIMCQGMNRSFVSVMLGGFGTDSSSSTSSAAAPAGDVHSVDAGGATELLLDAKKVIIIPGYGLAVAQAQHSLAEVCKILKEKGVDVKFAIHPVAGRLPGHMNVLLAEANIPYDIVFEMEEVNDDFPSTDVAWVIGANDIVNPSAMDDPGSPIAGMPVLHVWNARHCIVMKRGMASGYAGVDNPLF